MKELTLQLGFKYSTFMNWKAGRMIYGIANSTDILWCIEVSSEILYYTQPYIEMLGHNEGYKHKI